MRQYNLQTKPTCYDLTSCENVEDCAVDAEEETRNDIRLEIEHLCKVEKLM